MDAPSSHNPTQRADDSDTDIEKVGITPERQSTLQTADHVTQAATEKKEAGNPSHDEEAVNWDGLDDPENPMNWPDNKKWLNIILISVLTLVT